jgi:glucose/arabinose dehydrogenase
LKIKNKFVLSIMIAAAVAGIAVAVFMIFTSPTTVAWELKSEPMLHDDRLVVELVAEGLDSPTSMRFLGDSAILVLEKNKGQVRVVLDGKLLEEPVIQVEAATDAEQGLLGIAI